MDRPKQIGGPRQVRQGQIEKQVLPGFTTRSALRNVIVVIGAFPDGMIEDGRVRGEPGHRKFSDVALERAAIEQVPRDVIEPQALAKVVD